MASCIPRMNRDDFLRFMETPDSKSRIVEEYKSIVTKLEEGIYCLPEQTEEVEIKGCLSYLQFLYYGTQLKNNEVITRISFVDGYDVKQKFLCTKNPREEDCGAFWKTVWDNQVELIVMMGQLNDKSYQYWSPQEKRVLVCGKFKVKTRKIMVYSCFTVTLLNLTATELQPKQMRSIIHCQYTGWPNGNLCQAETFLNFYGYVDSVYLYLRDKNANKKCPPILVHCFDGLGKSQVFCAIDIWITQFEMTKMLFLSDGFEEMREQKRGSINSPDLYVLCYQVMQNYLQRV
uniref:Protein tyrosine phosphatase n=1 Tax=Glyptapanteles indiensis TaxID=92994 RepID=B7S983_GLYIN|nr:protein tyrosine phosphatase [Glyptapanteles indiensis]